MDKGNIRIQGTLEDIKAQDPTLYSEWREIMTKKKAEIDKKIQQKTGKERWKLLRLVSKIGLQKHRTNEGKWQQEDEVSTINFSALEIHLEYLKLSRLTYTYKVY